MEISLVKMFVNKEVRITHTNKRIMDAQGLCKSINKKLWKENHFEMELENQIRYVFVPEIVAHDYVDGELPAPAGGNRKIELVK
ncbi:MAG: hypothetical protein WCO07_03465 [bacterium]